VASPTPRWSRCEERWRRASTTEVRRSRCEERWRRASTTRFVGRGARSAGDEPRDHPLTGAATPRSTAPTGPGAPPPCPGERVDEAVVVQAEPVQDVGGHPGLARGDVVRPQQRAVGVAAHDEQHPVVAGVPHLGGRGRVQLRQRPAYVEEAAQAGGDAVRVVARLHLRPRHPRPVHPAVVRGVGGVVGPAGVVEQAELVAHPEHGQAAEAEDDRVREQDPGDGVRVTGLEAGQRRQGSGDPPVAGLLVVLEDQPARPRAGERAGVPVGQEPPVGERVQAHGPGVLVGDGPADVVVAARVGDPRGRRRRLWQPLEGVGRQAHVPRGEHRPDLHHQAVVVGEVAHPAGVLPDPEVGRQVRRGDDRLRLEEDRGRGDARHRAQGAGEVVDLGLVLAGGAEALPDEGDRVEPEHLHAEVGQRQDDVGELAQHGGVRPGQVPLVVVEGRPDPARELVVPGEVAGREVGEHLRQGGLVGVRHLPVGVDVEVGPLVGVAGAGGRGPLVLTRDVVQHQVEAQADPVGAQRRRQLAQVLERAEVGAHRPVVHHRVAAVVGRRTRGQQRHQVQVADAEVTEVRRPLAHAAQRRAEPVRVRGVAHRRRPLEPVRLAEALRVERAQVGGACLVRGPGDPQQPFGRVRCRGGAVDPLEGAVEVRRPRVDPALEGCL
jgi:hypothetical protein